MKSIGFIGLALALVGCGGAVAGSQSSGGDPGSNGNQPPGSQPDPLPGPGSQPNMPPQPVVMPTPPVITVDGFADKGQFTAMTLGSNSNLYAAETVYDNGTGGAAVGTTLWEIVPGLTTGTKTAVLSSPDIGIALSLAFRSKETITANLVWMDGVGAKGDLKQNAGGAVSVLSQHIAGAELLSVGADLYADSDGSNCIARIDGATHTCTGSSYSNPLQGGNGFHVVGNSLYGADKGLIYVVDIGTKAVTTYPLPDSIKGDGTLPPVFDVTADNAGDIFLATRVGVWMRDAVTGGFTNLYGTTEVQQVEETPGFVYVNVIGEGLVQLDEFGTKQATLISSDIAINTRFALGPQRVHWIGAAEKSLLHFDLAFGG
jgi:hypothetical protein